MNVIEQNIGKAINSLKSQKIVGMSLDNLFQVTSTRGLSVPVWEYRGLFDVAAKIVAAKKNFRILEN